MFFQMWKEISHLSLSKFREWSFSLSSFQVFSTSHILEWTLQDANKSRNFKPFYINDFKNEVKFRSNMLSQKKKM